MDLENEVAAVSKSRLPQGQGGERSGYSVTELEIFIECPRAWLIGELLGRGHPYRRGAALGIIAHTIMERALLIEPARRAEFARLAPVRLGAGRFPPRRLKLLGLELERAVQNYAGPDWPFHSHHAETALSIELRGRLIRGRVDRIDYNAKELLVLDYKSGRVPATDGRLQPYLYPLMAAREFALSPLGFLYIGLARGAHRGSLVRELPLPDRGEIDLDWQTKSIAAEKAAAAAIDSIEEGDWYRTGLQCGSNCTHRLADK